MNLGYRLVTAPRSQKTREVNSSGSRNPLKFLSSRKNMAKLLGRVASEYIQLVYHAGKAKAEHCLFFNEIEWVCEPYHSVRCLLISVTRFCRESIGYARRFPLTWTTFLRPP